MGGAALNVYRVGQCGVDSMISFSLVVYVYVGNNDKNKVDKGKCATTQYKRSIAGLY